MYKRFCIGFGIMLFSFLFLSLHLPDEKEPMSQREFYGQYTKQPQIVNWVYDLNKYYGVEPELILGLIRWESGFNPNAIGYNKYKDRVISVDQGLGQLNSNYFKGTYVFDPIINVHLTLKHFSEVLYTVNTVPDAIRKYRSGGISRNNPDVERYVNHILTYAYDLRFAWQEYLNNFYAEEK